MDCRQPERDELVEQYLQGQMSSSAQDEFEVHILECSACLQAVETLQALREGLEQEAQRIRSEVPVRKGWFRWQWAAGLAVLLIVLGVGFQSYRHRRPVQIAQPKAPALSSPVPGIEPPQQTPGPSDQVVITVPGPPPPPKKMGDVTVTATRVGSEEVPSPDVKAGTPEITIDKTPTALMPDEKAVAHASPKDTAPQPNSATSQPVDEELAKELFLLGDVQAPAYTFSGFAATVDKSQKTGPRRKGTDAAVSITPGAGNLAQGRVYFEQAMGAYVDRRYGNAAALLEEAVQAQPNAEDANFYLGVCRLLVARPSDAIAPLTKILANPKSPFTQSAHFYLAKAFIQTQDLAQAEEHLRAADAVPGRLSTQAHSLLGKVQALRARQQPPLTPPTTLAPN